MMAQGANALTEYGIHVFVVTWMLPVLKQLIRMEAAYETDEVVLALAASKAKLFPRYGVSKITDDMLNANLTMTVNVGMGATDPEARLQRFTHATKLYDGILKSGMPDADLPQFRKQIYGLAGFPNAIKFFKKQVDPALEQAKKVAATAEQEAQKLVDGQKFQLLDRERALDKREMQLKGAASQNDSAIKAQEAGVDMRIAQQESAFEMRLQAREAQFDEMLATSKAAHERSLKEAAAAQDRELKRLAAAQQAHIAAQNARNRPNGANPK
jgi:hypothetical protein